MSARNLKERAQIQARSPLSDSCPQCCAQAHIAPVQSQLTDDETSILSNYRCPYCEHTWRTWWNVAVFTAAELHAAGFEGCGA